MRDLPQTEPVVTLGAVQQMIFSEHKGFFTMSIIPLLRRKCSPIKRAPLFLTVLLVTLSCASAQTKGVDLGVTVPLTGNLSTYGEQIRHGVELAASTLKSSGVAIRIHFEDTPMSGPTVLSVLHSLIHSRKISGIAGNFSNVAMLTMAPSLEKSRVVAMHTAAMDDDILEAGKGWIFSTNTRVRDEAGQLASYAWRVGARKAAIVTIETNFGQGYRKHFKEAFEKLGGIIIADEAYQLGDVDYRAQLTRVRAKSPDIVFAATFGHFLGLTLRQGRELGITAPFVSVYESEDPSVVEAAGQHADGLRYFVSYGPAATEEALQIRRELAQRLGREPSTFSLNSYDATMLLARVVVSCRGISQCVPDSLRRIKDYSGISGILSIGADGAAERRFSLRQVARGNFVSVGNDKQQ